MLEEAKRKDIYKRIICDYLGPNRLDIEDGKICVRNFFFSNKCKIASHF